MKKYLFLLGLIVLAVIGCVGINQQSVFADETITVTFDYNVSRISKYLPSEMTKNLVTTTVDYSTTLIEPVSINKSIGYYYDHEWTLNGVVVNLDHLTATDDITLVARWTPKEYNIKYCYMTHKEKTEITNFQEFDTYSIESPVVFYRPERPHYNFIDWYMSPAFRYNEVTLYTDTYSIGDKILYAKWQPIEYFVNYHTDIMNNNNPLSYNIESVDFKLQPLKKEGYKFKGWYLDENCTYAYDTIKQGSYGNLDLYPLWESKVFDVKYIMPNGDVQVVSTSYGQKANSPQNYNSIFELVVYKGDRSNITGNTEIQVEYVNVWYLYVIGLAVIIGAILAIIFAVRHKYRQLHKLRYIYHSNLKRK